MRKVASTGLVLLSLPIGILSGASCRSDLQGTLTCPSQCHPGQELKDSLKVTVTNAGRRTASGFLVDLVISSDTTIPVKLATYSPHLAEDALLQGGREHVDSLAGGQSTNVALHGSNKIPDDTPPGTRYLGLVMDSGKTVSELKETNNTAVCRIEVAECAPTAAIAAAQIIEASGGTVGYARLRLRWTYGGGVRPQRLSITVFRGGGDTWDNIMPGGQAFEVPSPETTTESDVIIFRLFSGNYRMVFHAYYTCDRTQEYSFDQHLGS